MSGAGITPEDDLLAAELAFDLADAEERAVGEARFRADPAFAAAHDRWLADAVMLAGAREETPSQAVWDGIRRHLPANQPQRSMPPARPMRRWQVAAFAAALAAIILATFGLARWTRPPIPIVARSVPAPAQPPLVAILTGSDRRATVAVSFTRAGGRLAIMPSRVETGQKAAELWVIPAGGQPHAIGVIATDHPSWRPIAIEPRRYLVRGAVLAVSLEPAGGSPTGQPTGPVILTGTVVETS